MLRLDAPFVLLDDARDGGAAARLYTAPVGIVAAYTPQEVVPALERLRQARRDGLHAAGLIAYEAGAALEPNVPAAAIDGPLLWFGLFGIIGRWRWTRCCPIPPALDRRAPVRTG